MPASKSSGSSRSSSRSETSKRQTNVAVGTDSTGEDTAPGGGDGLTSIIEQLANRVFKPLDLVVLTRERIQETMDEAAERGRVTHTDANALVSELVRRGRQGTDDLFRDIEQLLGRGRDQIGSATRRARRAEPVDRLVRASDRARRTVSLGSSFPISGYDDLTAGQVTSRLGGLSPAQLRKVREYERRHANRKSVLAAIEKALG
jgi:polyhydroxyalkanoate synthesis regulator phasin